MKNHPMMWRVFSLVVALFAALSLTFAPVLAPDFTLTPAFADSDDDDDDDDGDDSACSDLPSFAELDAALSAVVAAGGNAGLGNHMWATLVDRVGIVCEVTRTGDLGDQWPGSRVISAQKANTGNSYSLPASAGSGIALSSGNLYGTALEQGTLFGLQFSNPVDPKVAYDDTDEDAEDFGTDDDPMKGEAIGGVNVFGGGLALYISGDELVGGLGVSGDTSCTDHVVAWKVRDALDLDNVPGGVSAGTDNLIITNPVIPSTFAHPDCDPGVGGVDLIIAELPDCYPTGAVKGPVLPMGVSGTATTC